MEKETTSILKTLGFIVAILVMAACNNKKTATGPAEEGDTLVMRHARHLCLIQHSEYMEAIVRNPWDTTQILNRYILSEKHIDTEQHSATFLKTPCKNAAVFTGVICALLQELGCEEAIGGVCEIKYIDIPYIHKGVQEGRIANLGSGMSPNIEQIMDLQPDVLMPSSFENNSGYGRLERLGIPIVGCAEYMETSPLAQAEWMRFYGRLFGKGALADSLFAQIEKDYLEIKSKAMAAEERPCVISELPQSGKWFVAAGESTTGQLYQDAGADYAFSHIPGNGSVAISMEEALEKAMHADFWLIKRYGNATREQLTKGQPGLDRIPAQMWLCDTEKNHFFEETPFHPEWLLKQLIQIFHPELQIKTDKQYFYPLD